MKRTTNIFSILLACLALAASQLAAADIAGKAYFVHGDVRVVNARGQSHPLRKGLLVDSGDTIATGQDGSAQIGMLDGGVIAVRPDSAVKIDQFVYHGKLDGKEKSFISVLRGGLRAITGLIGGEHQPNYQFKTFTATLGVRGTDHEIYVVAPGSPQAAHVPPGTYNKVNTGSTYLSDAGGSLDIHPNQMGFADASGNMPQLQPLNVELFTVPPPPPPGHSAPQKVREHVTVDHVVLEPGAAVQPLAAGTSINATPTISITSQPTVIGGGILTNAIPVIIGF